MSKSNVFENAFLELIFNGTAISGLADNASSSPLTELYVALHTADPGEAGNQTTNEISYTGYARVAVPRDGTGWTVTNNVVTPANNIEFGEMTGGTGGEVTHFSIGTDASGTGRILYSGTVTPNIPVAVGGIPRLKDTSTITEE